MYSIRRRLTLLLTLSFALLIAAAGVYLERLLSTRLVDEFDAALLAEARAIATMTEQEAGFIEMDFSSELMPGYQRETDPDYFELWLVGGPALKRSERLGDRHLSRISAEEEEPAFADVTLPDGRRGRQVEYAFVPQGPEEDDDDEAAAAETGEPAPVHRVVIAVARGRAPLDKLLTSIHLTLGGVGLSVIVLAALLVWRSLVAGLRPLGAVAGQVQALDAESLDQRIRLPSTPRELAPVVQQLNALLERLDASFERERRFAGNVAHELRTPLAELRSLAEVGAKWPDDPDAMAGFFADVRAISLRMESLVKDLLLLARCQAGLESVERRRVDLKELLGEVWARLAKKASVSRTVLDPDLPASLVVESDPGKLDIIVSNLLDNAVSHSPPGASVRCSGRSNGAAFHLTIENETGGLGREDLERVAEPFWQKDQARSSPDHLGLGLALASALAGLLGLRLSFELQEGGRFQAILEGGARLP